MLLSPKQYKPCVTALDRPSAPRLVVWGTSVAEREAQFLRVMGLISTDLGGT